MSTAITHAGNISYRLGKKAPKTEILEQVKGIKIWEDMFARLCEHLKAHEIDVKTKAVTLGPWLEIDPKTETFKNNDAANRLAHGFYRKGFIVPDLS